MRFGNASRTQVIILAIAIVIAALMVPRFFSSNSPAASTVATAASPTAAKPLAPASRSGRRAPQRKAQLAPSLDPALRFDLLKMGETQEYQGTKRDIFSARQIEIPKPV